MQSDPLLRVITKKASDHDAAALAAAQTQGQVQVDARIYVPQQFLLKAQANLAEVAVVVRDRSGNAIAGLTQNDFQLLDDSRPVAISAFTAFSPTPASTGVDERPTDLEPGTASPTASAQPQYVAMYLDQFGMTAPQLALARTAAEKFRRWRGSQANAHYCWFPQDFLATRCARRRTPLWPNALQHDVTIDSLDSRAGRQHRRHLFSQQ